MKLKTIVDAINRYYSNKFPKAKGWFIGKESTEPTKLNAYKQYRAEIYYHLPGKNYLVFQTQLIDRCYGDSEETVKENLSCYLLSTIFANIKDLDKYETIQTRRV